MDHLQAGIQLSFAILPESAAFFEPCEGAFDDPSLGHDSKGVQFASLRDLHGRPDLLLDRLGEWSARVTSVHQHAPDLGKVASVAVEGLQSAIAVRYHGRRDGNRVRQTLHIDGDVALDTRDLLARIVALLPGRAGVLHALRVNDQEAGGGAPPLSGAVLANRFFLAPVPERSRRPNRAPTTWQDKNAPFATSETRPEACATGSRS